MQLPSSGSCIHILTSKPTLWQCLIATLSPLHNITLISSSMQRADKDNLIPGRQFARPFAL
jgi:hypothetical protein